jgi:3-oxoacyl-[acyl-carrier-protein] synthase II
MECAICLLAMEHQWLPPTLNLETPDAGSSLDLIPKHGRPSSIKAVLTNSFGFGGVDSCLVLTKL